MPGAEGQRTAGGDGGPVGGWRAAVAAGLGAAAAGWVLAGVFDSGWARAVGLLAPAVGAAVAGLSLTRWRRSPLAPWLGVPAAAVLGWLVVVPSQSGAALPRLVSEALRSGGVSQPPVPFDPGWRFVLAAVLVLLASASAQVASSRGSTRLAPLPGAAVVVMGVLVQPADAAVASVCGALALMAASLAVAVGESADGEEADGGRRFEARRLARGAGAVAGLLAVVVGLSQLGFLFPSGTRHQVIPPKRPQVPPGTPADRVLFTVAADRPVPLRLGVLDGYDGRGFLTPPYDTARFKRIGPVRGASGLRARITIADLGGHLLPGLASPKAVVGGGRVQVDPRTDQLRLPGTRAAKGLAYTVIGAPVPSAAALDHAGPPPASMREFTKVPPPPPPVAQLLAAAPTTPYARVQYLRTALYSHVVAAGAGNPVDVPPGRVVDFLDGKQATPYEITAAEVMLARWARVPARIGYGYYNPAGGAQIRPRDGATWLEAYFDGFGWVPIVGAPPRAKSSFNRAPKKTDPLVRPTDQLALVVYVPVRLTTVQLLYTEVRFWLLRLVPVALALAALWCLWPAARRGARRWRRRRWATGRGAPERLLVAYAGLRDAAIDANVGRPDMTALELVDAVAPDEEHRQLAWLVTRGLWGDLRRDLTEDDVRAGEDMAASVVRRLRRAQSAGARFGALVSRASLRAPWSDEVPGPPRLPRPRLPRRPSRWHLSRPRRPSRRLLIAAVPVAALLLLVSVRLAFRNESTREPGVAAPAGGVAGAAPVSGAEGAGPAAGSVGGVELRDEPGLAKAFAQAGPSSIVGRGRVLSVRRDDAIEGSLQVADLKPGVTANDAVVRRAVVKSIGRGGFRLTRIGALRVYVLDLPDQRFLLWFPPDGRSFDLMVTRATFDVADRVFLAAVAHAPAPAQVPVPDPRRGVAD